MGAATTALFGAGPIDDAFEPWRPEPADETAPGSAARHARVLVVEDEQIVRTWIARLLEEAGHAVRVAVSGADALRLVADDPAGFDLLITDVRMPGVDGWELGRRLTERWPDMPILYISGYDVQLPARSVTSFLRKPFDSELLLRRVSELLKGG